MICPKCREGQHGRCPELARQTLLTDDVCAMGSQLCECQHGGRPATMLAPVTFSDEEDDRG